MPYLNWHICTSEYWHIITTMKIKPDLSFWKLWNISFGFFGVQIAYALQSANISRIFATLGADPHSLSYFWILPPLAGIIIQPIIGSASDKTWTRFGRRIPYLFVGSLIAVLVIAIIGVTYLLFTEKQANRELVQEFQLDKEDLENEYTRFAQQYDELKMTISNDSLSQLLEQEQLKTQRLLEELRTVKSSNATEIRRLKKELATLRKVMIGYINQIDSLNKLTVQQKQVIAEVTQKYNQASRQIDNLSEEKKNLDKKVMLAAQLDATNIRVEPRNKRGKVAKKVKDVVKLAISFTIVKNITAENGERTVYIRITKPDNDVLTKSASNTFPYENRTLTYSIKKYIEYNGEEQNVNVFWDVEEFLYAGNYRVDIFEGGNLIGSQAFTLN